MKPNTSSAYNKQTAFPSHGFSECRSMLFRIYLTTVLMTIVRRMAYSKPKTSWTDAPLVMVDWKAKLMKAASTDASSTARETTLKKFQTDQWKTWITHFSFPWSDIPRGHLRGECLLDLTLSCRMRTACCLLHFVLGTVFFQGLSVAMRMVLDTFIYTRKVQASSPKRSKSLYLLEMG